jgi:hypothetical protein
MYDVQECGDVAFGELSIAWAFCNGELFLVGSGETPFFRAEAKDRNAWNHRQSAAMLRNEDAPWYHLRNEICEVIVNPGIHTLNRGALRNMPNLEALIMGDSDVASLEPLRDCKKLTFLEIFTTNVTDLSPLEDCKELRYLNISNLKIDDITPLYELDNMVKLNSTMNHIPAEQVEKYKELQPRCYATFLPYGDPTEYEWRYFYNNQINPRYLLLKHQMGYANGNVSGYPYGHVTEPITYESIGIDPPPYEWQEWD